MLGHFANRCSMDGYGGRHSAGYRVVAVICFVNDLHLCITKAQVFGYHSIIRVVLTISYNPIEINTCMCLALTAYMHGHVTPHSLEHQLLSRCGSMSGDDGILDCLEHFVERGEDVVLVTGRC